MTPDGDFPVVMVHGWPESSYCWTRVAEALPARFRVIAPDLRGLGDSERTPEREAYHKNELARDMLTVLEELGIEQCHLVGHDWGGAVAQEMALTVPERFHRFCLMNMVVINNVRGNREVMEKPRNVGNPALWYQHFQRAPKLAEAMIPGNEEVWLRYFLPTWSDTAFPEDAVEEYVRCYRIPGTPATGANYYRTMRDDAKRWATLGERKFPMPSLYIYGNKDVVIVPDYLNHLEDAFDSVEIKQIEANHFVQEEQPEAVAAYLADFLDSP
jgi:pimeloyl-ACP methyl ester carboxylesterase